MNAYLKLSLLGLLAFAAACASAPPAPKLAPANAASLPASDIAAPPPSDTEMTYSPKAGDAKEREAPLTSVRPKDAAAQGKGQSTSNR